MCYYLEYTQHSLARIKAGFRLLDVFFFIHETEMVIYRMFILVHRIWCLFILSTSFSVKDCLCCCVSYLLFAADYHSGFSSIISLCLSPSLLTFRLLSVCVVLSCLMPFSSFFIQTLILFLFFCLSSIVLFSRNLVFPCMH